MLIMAFPTIHPSLPLSIAAMPEPSSPDGAAAELNRAAGPVQGGAELLAGWVKGCRVCRNVVKEHSPALSSLQGRKQNSWLAGTCSTAGLANVLWFLLLLRQGTDQRATGNVGLLSPLGAVCVVSILFWTMWVQSKILPQHRSKQGSFWPGLSGKCCPCCVEPCKGSLS